MAEFMEDTGMDAAMPGTPLMGEIDFDIEIDPEDFAEEQALAREKEAFVSDHYANLAEVIDEGDLRSLASDINDWIERDEESRSDWEELRKAGIQKLGLNPREVKRPKAWMSKVTHPLIKEAVIQFCARAISEVWPTSGPAAAKPLGDPTKELREQAIRVEDYLNYLYNHQMPDAFDEEESMLVWIALAGSAFKKVYYCPIANSLLSVTIPPNKLIVPFDAANLRTANRYTEWYEDTHADHLRKVAAGLYREVDRLGFGDGQHERDDIQEAVDESEGRSNIMWSEDQLYKRYEVNCYLDLPGFESEDGVPLPYVVILDDESQEILSIRRAWKEGDPTKQRRRLITHYKFLRGLGFYGWGFLQTLGSLGDAATGALRNLLDSAYLSNAQGGFTSRHMNIKTDIDVVPGTFKQLDVEPDKIKSAFFPFPFKEPSQTLYRLLEYLDSTSRRFASTTEAMVGENSPGTPVGTTMALIEQGSQILTGIQRRIHVAKAEELAIVADLCYEYLPPVYPYDVAGQSRAIKQADFDGRIDVVPVNDPDATSTAQRVAQAQSLLQLAQASPDLYDRREVNLRMLRALKVPSPEALLVQEQEPQPMDPASEGAALLRNQPVRAFPQQDHVAHLAALVNFWGALDDETRKGIEPQYRALLQDHMAHYYMAQMQNQTGASPEQMADPRVVQMVAQVRPTMLLPFADDAAEQEALDEVTQREEHRKDIKVAGEMRRKDMMAQAELDRINATNATHLAYQEQMAQMQLEIQALRDELGVLQELRKAHAKDGNDVG